MNARVSLALRERRGQAIPLAQLAELLKMPPASIGRAMEELAQLGFVIETHPMQGVRLVAPPPSLLEAELACELGTRRVGRLIRCVQSTASTNDLAWEAADDGLRHSDGLAIFAEHQSAGRGRRGNRWLAPAHSSILCSVVAWLPQTASLAAVLTRAAALASAQAVEEHTGLAAGIKWPNDVVVDDRKVGGILVEARPSVAAEAAPVVVGVGINCTQEPEAFPPEIRSSVASLRMVGEEPDRTLLARSLMRRLDEMLARMADEQGMASLRTEAAARCRTIGRRIAIQEGDKAYCGQVVDLDDDYGLVIRLSDGGIRVFPAMTSHVTG